MKPLIVANWKMNPASEKEAKRLFHSVKKTGVIICLPFVYLKSLAPYKWLGAQDVFWEREGAYTGEISAVMLKDLGCKYLIVGHSERRRYFKETDEIVNKKLKAVLRAKMTPIFCIGETGEEREQEKTRQVLEKEITSGLKGVSDASKVIIAYEPIWAIGTGNPCDVEEAQKMRLLIRKIAGRDIKILYGGSVNSKNAAGYIKEAGFDGLLVGGASLDTREFIDLVRKTC